MLEATVTPDPAFALKLKTNHLKSPQLEAKLVKAITDWVHIFFHNLGSRDVKVLIENDSFKDIIAIHKKEQNGNDSAPGILPILKELVAHMMHEPLIVPYVYISHEIPEGCENIYSGSWGPPTKLLKSFEELEIAGQNQAENGTVG